MMYKPMMVDLLLVLGAALLPVALAADSSSAAAPPPPASTTAPPPPPTKTGQTSGPVTSTPKDQGKTVTVTTTITQTSTTVLTATESVLDHSTVNSVLTVTDSAGATETDVVWVTITDPAQRRAVAVPTAPGLERRAVVPRQAAGTVTVTETKVITSFVTSTTTAKVTSVDTTTVVQTQTKVLNAQTTVTLTSTTHVAARAPDTVTNGPSNTGSSDPGPTTTGAAPGPVSSGSGLSTAAIGGIAAGGAVAVIAVVLGLFFFFRRRRHSKADDDDYFYDPNAPSSLNNSTNMKQPTVPDIRFMFTPQHHAEPYNAAASVPYSDTLPYSDTVPGASNLAGLAPTLPVLDRGEAISPATSGRLSPAQLNRSPSPATLVGSPPLSASAVAATKKDWRSSTASAGAEQEADGREILPVPEMGGREVNRDAKPESYEMDASSPPMARHPAFREDVPEMDGRGVHGYEMDATDAVPRQELAGNEDFVPGRTPASGSRQPPRN